MEDLIPAEKSKFGGMNDKVVVDGSNGVGGLKLKDLGGLLNSLVIEVRNSSEDGGVLNDEVGADYVQKEKVVPHCFGSKDAGIRLVCHLVLEVKFMQAYCLKFLVCVRVIFQ